MFYKFSTVLWLPKKGSNLESVDSAGFVKIARNDPDGRESAYSGKTVTWEKLLRSKKTMKLKMELIS